MSPNILFNKICVYFTAHTMAMHTGSTTTHDIYFNEVAEAGLNQFLTQNDYSHIFILVDKNTEEYCLGPFLNLLAMEPSATFTIKPGEENKTIEACVKVWNALSQNGGDRKSILINLGGGVVTDLGGFVASTFKRGIDFINIPTTLLAMVDASVGGKTGVDLGVLKNQVGVINQPRMVLLFPEFLKTLPENQLRSGFAEMLKHGLIADKTYWKALSGPINLFDEENIRQSIKIKDTIVSKDPTEKGVRKALNFGHTLGHAIESYFLENSKLKTLLHGEAIAIGMILEGYLSHKLTGLSKMELDDIKQEFRKHFKKVNFTKKDIAIIIDLLKHDKKNTHGNINFVLLAELGQAVIDIKVPTHLFNEAFAYYKEP